MCGICGASLAARDAAEVQSLARDLLLGIEERGRHATGLAWESDGDVWIDKAAISATTFTARMPNMGTTRAFLGHTRWASQGSPSNPLNNHPIDADGVVGIHNGVLSNDDDIFGLLGPNLRRGEVDSEAIFALLRHGELPVEEALPLLHGSAAIAWLDTVSPNVVHLARVSSSPVTVGITRAGSVLFSSTISCLKRVQRLVGDFESIYALEEGTYLALYEGEIVDIRTFEVCERYALTATERRALNLEPQH
jgi:glucosamine 6-phosphate synthetase-like amidotransferase/phosphosugar isomerase protein